MTDEENDRFEYSDQPVEEFPSLEIDNRVNMRLSHIEHMGSVKKPAKNLVISGPDSARGLLATDRINS